ncbi:MobA/MobL family protein [Pseudomonas lundensis]|uniref:MobA/MobL family protein n=1 Tax=Pseudomonas lundensis TaxID=86185 RepID=UPI001F4C89A7|nr:MobA/MobL family protein [Pseudomonas lundensis]
MGNSLLEHLRRVVGRNFGPHHLWQDGQHVASFSPEGMAPQPSAELWNRAEAAEVRKNARVAREVLVALRAELSPAQRRELTLGIAQALADRYGTAGTLAVHTPDREGDQRNHHAHILMTTRRLEPSGALGEKTRELDDVKRGPEEIEWVRAMIEARTNHALERAGSAERVDRRSLFEQRAPLGTVTRLQANNDRRQLTADRAELGAVSAQIIDIEQARAERAAREQATGAASAGLEAFKARFQQSQDVAARIEAERARLTAEAQRVAQERAAEQAAQERAQEQERAAKAQKHAALSNAGPVKRGRSGPDFSM